jgi:sec-independent protein translocase protein TatC
MKHTARSGTPPTMLHHVKEIQLRLLATVVILLVGMVVGYLFYEQLFQFIKLPLNAPLHYTSPAGSFSFIIKICLMVGIVVALPVAVYNAIMFVQPALHERLSRTRVYVTTFLSLILAGVGASFAFLVIIPMALRFFFQFQVDGLEALISADDYLRFVVNGVITFALIFQLPLIISLIDHVNPLPPKKLFKAEKFIIIGSVAIGVLVPFALDPTIQLLIASPIIILYNVSIGIVLIQRAFRKRREKSPPLPTKVAVPGSVAPKPPARQQALAEAKQPVMPAPVPSSGTHVSGMVRRPRPAVRPDRARQPSPRNTIRPPRTNLISDMRPARSRSATPRSAGSAYTSDDNRLA